MAQGDTLVIQSNRLWVLFEMPDKAPEAFPVVTDSIANKCIIIPMV